MNNFQISLKERTFKEDVEIKNTITPYIQPFKEMPSLNDAGTDNADRIDAHDLFSHYTADIIKEDVIFAR